MSAEKPFIVGLTGGIGSGKTAVTSRFATHGIVIVDTDLIAHALTAPGGEAIDPIRTAFGSEMIATDGRLDRGRMRQLVFAHPEARLQLESILHPMIRLESARQCLAASSPYVILAVPLLIESGTYRERCDRICVVDCTVALQVERVRARNGLSIDEIKAIIASQSSREEKLGAADDVIDNSGSLQALNSQVDALHLSYMALAA